jgi:glycolate oxidase FAD binding subunit
MPTSSLLRPASAADLADAIADAARVGTRLELRGGGSKADIGAPRPDSAIVDMRGFAGVIDYDPAELVLTAGAGTPLAELDALVAEKGQMLAFEPFDHGPIFARPAGTATIGGIVAAGVAGSRRVAAGGVRDHLLGFRGVSGRGEPFVAGAKVVKNVTGYDLPKLVCGSWGRLVALTEVTLKVLPRPRTRATRMIDGLDLRQARLAMARAMGSKAELSAAAHVPARGGSAVTAFRIEGFGASVTARCRLLDELLGEYGAVRAANEEEADGFWSGLRTLASLGEGPLWRVNVAPSAGPAVIEALEPLGARWLFDWAGGLVWLTFEGDPLLVRRAAVASGGHATLVRAPEELRARVPALHPPAPGVMALEARLRRAFDPNGLFETGRFLDTGDAD